MASQNVLVKDLQGVETLGTCRLCFHLVPAAYDPSQARWVQFNSIFDLAYHMCQLTLLATDKTGTLTRNQMTVWTGRLSVNWRLTPTRPGNEPMELQQNVLSIPVEQ